MKIDNLTAVYGDKKVLDNLNVEFKEGQITCVLGHSGAGKTTLLKCIANLKDYEGIIEGESPSFVFQEPRLIDGITVYKNLSLVGLSDSDILSGLKSLNMLDKMNEYPKSLSGGERQRINFLRALYYPSNTILMDEPFSSLDIGLKLSLINDFISIWKEKKQTVIFVTHDIEEALLLAERVLVIKQGKIAFDTLIEDEFPREYYGNEKMRKLLLSHLL
ncbi:MAG: ABC transporter ATP-binding protein [Clostridia bacterium]|nr:ABC transporter ATP-binding protein [Clostridia bacterium]MBQ4098271.1 ABC transporter ATP-binding protein [Clostridia bacterium]